MTATPRPPHTISLRERADGGRRPHVLQVRALAASVRTSPTAAGVWW